MKTFNQFIAEAKKPLPLQKMLNQASRHSEFAGWVTGEFEGNRWNQSKKRKSAMEIIDRAKKRAKGINDFIAQHYKDR